jgi:hypothetical protein
VGTGNLVKLLRTPDVDDHAGTEPEIARQKICKGLSRRDLRDASRVTCKMTVGSMRYGCGVSTRDRMERCMVPRTAQGKARS